MTRDPVYRLTSCDEEPRYRYALTAATDAPGDRRLVVVQCNPSLADASRSDATVGKVATWAAGAGFAAVTFVNLFAYRGPHVDALLDLPYDVLVGPRNDDALARHAAAADVLIVAWGATLPVASAEYDRRLAAVASLCRGRPVHRVGELVRRRGRAFPRHGRMWNGRDRACVPLTWAELAAGGPVR